ncbi:actinodin1 [Chanos chanos]|uniref:Actinodin1 n=1 Tax=Chanos chanos TaxID=29144 RepID=A0A6J2UTP2_CHACN|nr:uncharacterized protein LOC115806708 [Chanos chanos]
MAGRFSASHIFTGVLLATVLLPEFLLAGPVAQRLKGDDGSEERVTELASPKRLIRNRRNISWYKQHSDFWNWYKFFSDNGNQEALQELDRVYLAYLQNKNRAEGRRSHKLYLRHLSEIYKSCAESEDPNCVASYTSRPKPKAEPPKPAPVKACDPYKDPYCLYSMGYGYPYLAPAPVKSPAPPPPPAPAPVKAPAYIHSPVVKDPRSGYYYYAPMVQSFLTSEQKAELLRICDAEDVECLQYHLRAAYGYRPASGSVPSYAHLGCDPKTDPKCMPQLVQKTPSGLYLRYPHCDPRVDPYCAYAAALQAAQNTEAPSPSAPLERPCNPLFDDNCNPLTATKFASLGLEPESPKDEPASASGALRAPVDPYAMYRDAATAAAMLRHRPTQHQLPRQHYQSPYQEESRHPLGPRGKTKEGYDCFIGYDEECFPLRGQTEPRSATYRQTPHAAEAYEPHLNADGTRNGVIEPDPDCDPEYDSNCRLRRYEPEAEAAVNQEDQRARPAEERQEEPARHVEAPQHQEQAYREQQQQQPEAPSYDQHLYDRYMSGQEDPYAGYGPQEQPSSFQDMLRRYGDVFPNDHRAYTGDYRKK